MTNLTIYTLRTVGYTPTIQTFENKEYLVVPVVMMVEGVHHGSAGPLFHPIDELGHFPASWNGIPVVINHPEVNGKPVSANSPQILEQYAVGFIFNTVVDGMKLKAEAWLDPAKLERISQDTKTSIENHESIEVSVGVFTDNEDTPGTYNEEDYIQVARNHRPDHLALLPGGVGACSVEDGCGVRINSSFSNNNQKGGSNLENDNVQINRVNAEKFLCKDGFFTLNSLVSNKAGFTVIMDALRSKIDGMDNDTTYHYVEEVFDETFVYVSRMREGGSKLYKQGYQISDNVVTLVGDPIEVQKRIEVSYDVVSPQGNMMRTKFNTNTKTEKTMCTPCVKKKADALIANSQSQFTEDDREFLEGLSENQLDKLAPVVINSVSPDDQKLIDYAKAAKKALRDGQIKSIQDNTSKEKWPDEVLNSMGDDLLGRLAGMFEAPDVNATHVDYSFNRGGATPGVNSKDLPEPLMPVFE